MFDLSFVLSLFWIHTFKTTVLSSCLLFVHACLPHSNSSVVFSYNSSSLVVHWGPALHIRRGTIHISPFTSDLEVLLNICKFWCFVPPVHYINARIVSPIVDTQEEQISTMNRLLGMSCSEMFRKLWEDIKTYILAHPQFHVALALQATLLTTVMLMDQ